MSGDLTKPQNKCVPSEDSNLPGHPPSLIRVSAVCMKKAWVLSYPLSAQRRLIRLGRCPGWSESSLDAHSLCCFCHVVAHMELEVTPDQEPHDWLHAHLKDWKPHNMRLHHGMMWLGGKHIMIGMNLFLWIVLMCKLRKGFMLSLWVIRRSLHINKIHKNTNSFLIMPALSSKSYFCQYCCTF